MDFGPLQYAPNYVDTIGDIKEYMGELGKLCGHYWGHWREHGRTMETMWTQLATQGRAWENY